MAFPDDVPLVDSGDNQDLLLGRVKKVYASIYDVNIDTVRQDTPLGPRFADISANICFQLGKVVFASDEMTIGELVSSIVEINPS